MTNLYTLVFSLALAALLGISNAKADIVVNGGFELDSDSNSVPDGWTITSTGGGAANVGLSTLPSFAFEGDNSLGFNGGNLSPNAIAQQVVATTAGTEYVLTFHVARLANSNFAGTSQILGEVFDDTTNNLLGSELLADLTGSTFSDPNRPTYEMGRFNFTATGAQTLVRFTDATTNNGSNFDTYLDGVSITAVPEPSSMSLMSLVCVAWLGRRKRAINRFPISISTGNPNVE